MRKNNKSFISKINNLSLLIFSSLICFISAELFARYVLNFKTDDIFLTYESLDDSKTSIGPKSKKFRHMKASGDYDVEVRFNKYGFRDTKLISNSKEDSWLFVGDSFTFGHGVEEHERFSNKIEEIFKVDTFNLGIPNDLIGYKNIINYAKANGSRSANIILVICMENDLIKKETIASKNNYVRSKIPYLKRLKGWLHGNIALYQFVGKLSIIDSPLTDFLRRVGVIEKVIPNAAAKPSDYSVFKTTNFIKEFKKNADELVIVLIPSRYLWYGNDDNRKSYLKLHNEIASSLQNDGLMTIDLLPTFEKVEDPLFSYHFKYDGHWNKRGHLLAAEIIGNFLMSLEENSNK